MNKEALNEALKEVGRVFFLGALSAAIVYLAKVDTAWAFIVLGGLRGVDKYVHKDPNLEVSGILPF